MKGFVPYWPGAVAGVRWQDERFSGRRDMAAYMDHCVASEGPAEVLVADGVVLGAGGFAPFNDHWWHTAFRMAEGAPCVAWRAMLRWADGWIAHAVRELGAQRIDTHVIAGFEAGHHLALRLGFRFCGLDEEKNGLLVRYTTNGPRARAALHPEVERALRLTHEMILAVHAPGALRFLRRRRP